MFGDGGAVAQGYKRDHAFSVDRHRLAHHCSFHHFWVAVEPLLHFLRRDVESSPNNDRLLASIEPDISIRVTVSQIARVHPAIPQRLGGCLGIVPISDKAGWASHDDLARFSVRNILTFRIYQADF